MRKNITYSMRMNGKIRDLLQKAADREQRTVASLLDKIVVSYLQAEGYLPRQYQRQEHRRDSRQKTLLPAIAMQDAAGEIENFPCFVLDLSTGGVLLGFSKGSTFNISSRGELPRFKLALSIPEAQKPIRFDCAARHMRDTGDAIQMGCMFEPYPFQEKRTLENYLMNLSNIPSLS